MQKRRNCKSLVRNPAKSAILPISWDSLLDFFWRNFRSFEEEGGITYTPHPSPSVWPCSSGLLSLLVFVRTRQGTAVRSDAYLCLSPCLPIVATIVECRGVLAGMLFSKPSCNECSATPTTSSAAASALSQQWCGWTRQGIARKAEGAGSSPGRRHCWSGVAHF